MQSRQSRAASRASSGRRVRRRRCFARARRSRKNRPLRPAASGAAASHDRVGSFLRRPEQRPDDTGEAGKRGSEPGGVGPAGVHGVDGDAGLEQVSRPLLGQHDLRPLAARVCLRPVVGGGFRVEGVDVERLGVHAAGCHHDHARRCRRLEQRPQRAGQQERRQDVCRERRLVALARDRVFVGERAGVQDEHVEAVVSFGEAGREGRGLREGREVCEVGLDRGACRGGDLAADALGPRRVAPDDADVPAQRRDRLGGRSSEARGRPGHDCDLAVETKRLQRRPVEEAPPDVVADPGEAADDARLERPVDEVRRGRGRHGFSAVCIPSVARAPTRLKMRCMIGSSSRPSPPNARVAS